jgi:hypothetical protein
LYELKMGNDDLSVAVVRWTGRGVAAWPVRDDAVLISSYGQERGRDLVVAVHVLEEDFYRTEAHLTAPDLQAMGEQAAAEFRARHLNVTDEAVAA